MRHALVVAVSLILSANPVVAGTSSPADARIGKYERILFGEAHGSQPLMQRLNALETSVLGKAGKGGIQARLNAIGEVIDPDSQAQFSPPVAPAGDQAVTPQRDQSGPSQRDQSVAPRRVHAAVPKRDQSAAPKHAVSKHAFLPTERKEGHVDHFAQQADGVDDLLRQGMESYKQGRFDEAEQTFQRVLAEDGENPNALYNLGALTERRGELDASLRYYRHALSSSPHDKQLQGIVDELGAEVTRRRADEARAAAEREFALAEEGARREKGVRRVRNVTYPSTGPVVGVTQPERPYVARTERQRSSGRSFARVFAGAALSVGVGAAAGPLHCPLCRMIGGF